MPDRRVDAGARERLEEIHRGYQRYTRKTNFILVALAVVQIGLGCLSVYLVGQNGRRQDDNRTLISKVQAERAYSVEFNCEDVNRRHDAAIDELRNIVPEGTPEKELRPTKVLLNRVLPKRDCDILVAQFVETP